MEIPGKAKSHLWITPKQGSSICISLQQMLYVCILSSWGILGRSWSVPVGCLSVLGRSWSVPVGCVCASMFHCWHACGCSDLAWALWGSPERPSYDL